MGLGAAAAVVPAKLFWTETKVEPKKPVIRTRKIPTLKGRRHITIQNRGTKTAYVGSQAHFEPDCGFAIHPGVTYSAQIGDDFDIYVRSGHEIQVMQASEVIVTEVV